MNREVRKKIISEERMTNRNYQYHGFLDIKLQEIEDDIEDNILIRLPRIEKCDNVYSVLWRHENGDLGYEQALSFDSAVQILAIGSLTEEQFQKLKKMYNGLTSEILNIAYFEGSIEIPPFTYVELE